jgi:Vitamin K-dependent gamma-carboxylase
VIDGLRVEVIQVARPGVARQPQRLAVACPLGGAPEVASRLLRAWRRYWFPRGSLVELGSMRIVVCAIVLFLTTGLGGGVTRYLQAGIVPRELWVPLPIVAPLTSGPPSFALLLWLGRITLAATVASMVGVLARPALALLLPLLLVQEAWLNCAGKTTHATIPLIYAVRSRPAIGLSASIAFFSVVCGSDGRASTRAESERPPERSRFARWPIDLLFFEVSTFYFLAGLAKLRASGLAWADGSTLQYHLRTIGGPVAGALARVPWLCAWLSGLVLAFELTAPLGMIRSLRAPVLLAGVLFHIGTTAFLGIAFTPLLALYAVFVPWPRLARRIVRPGGRHA